MPLGTQEFSYHLGDDFFRKMESVDVTSGNVDVALSVKHIGNIYELLFTLNGVIGIPCDRCLEEMEHHVDTSYAMSIKYGDEYCEGDDQITIPETDGSYNVAHIIYDTVALTIPIMHVHPDGQCNEEMCSLLEEHMAGNNDGGNDDGDESYDPRWEALKKLKDNN